MTLMVNDGTNDKERWMELVVTML